MSDQLLPVHEVAKRLCIRPGTVRLYLWQRRLPFVRVGRLVRVRESDVDRFIKVNTVPADDARQLASSSTGMRNE